MKNVIFLALCLWAFSPMLSGMQQFDTQGLHADDSVPSYTTYSTQSDSIALQATSAVADQPVSNKPASLKKAELNLIGAWEHPLRAFDMATADASKSADYATVRNAVLRFTFRADGTYAKKLLNAPVKLEEYGSWELSTDGSALTLHSESGEAPQTIRVKHLQMDELVLEHALRSSEASICTSQKDFFFNRQ